jgi:hypothetical protein
LRIDIAAGDDRQINRLHRCENRRLGCVSYASAAAHQVTIELFREGVDKLVTWTWLDRRDRDNRERVREAFVGFALRAFERSGSRYL